MSNPLDGSTKPALSEAGEKEQKTRTYKTPSGESFKITEDEFSQIVAIFDFLRRSRDEQSTQPNIEPEETSVESINALSSRKAG